ncbi:MAG: hypothetical protein Q8R35_03520 [bacterium]|nr:hypothetical protein [bacterium]
MRVNEDELRGEAVYCLINYSEISAYVDTAIAQICPMERMVIERGVEWVFEK